MSRFRLFDQESAIGDSLAAPAARELYEVLARFREAVNGNGSPWSAYGTARDYASICFWSMRRLEYSFVANSFERIERKVARPMRVLDVGSGVVPLGSWVAGRGHSAVAIDPLVSDMLFLAEAENRARLFPHPSRYGAAEAERLPFADGSFDVALLISVLEHMTPGNDQVALAEIARVLRPGGWLVLTFDVAPPKELGAGEEELPPGSRRYGEPFTEDAARALLGRLSTRFEVGPEDVPERLAEITWDEVFDFWRRTQQIDGREEAERFYLAAGGVVRRLESIPAPDGGDDAQAYLEGQQALRERLDYFEYHAGERLRQLTDLGARFEYIEGQLRDAERQRGELGESITRLEEVVSERTLPPTLAEDLGGLVTAQRDAATDLETLEAARRAMEERLAAHRTRLAKLETELGGGRSEIERLESGLGGLESGLGDLESGLGGLESGLGDLESGLGGLESGLGGLESKIGGLGSEVSGLESGLEQIEGAVGSLGSEVGGFEREIDTLKQEIADLEDHVDRLRAKLGGRDKAIRGLEAHLERREGELDELRQRSDELGEVRGELVRRQRVIDELVEDRERRREIVDEAHAEGRKRAAHLRRLEAFRRTSVLYWLYALTHKLRLWKFLAPFYRAAALVRRGLRPRLGRLVHHPPIELQIPARYRQAPSPEADRLPTISIVTPSFNQAGFLERTMASVLDQAYPRLEYLVQDGASTDGTPELLAAWKDRLASAVSEPDEGQADAINRAFARTSGEIMAYLNSDDLLLPGSLAYVGDFFARHPEVDAVYGHRVLIDAEDREIGRWVLPPHDDEILDWADYIPQETLFWRRRLWERSGAKMDESFQFALDWDLVLRFQECGARFARLPRFLGAFRIHDTQKTSARISDLGQREMQRLRRRQHGRAVPHEETAKAVRPYLRRSILCHNLYRAGLLRY